MADIQLEDVRAFWDRNPLCAANIPHPMGTREYFAYYDGLREAIESREFSANLHEYEAHRGKKVLDVGCGNGYVLSRYAAAGATVYGVDVTPTAIELSRGRFALANLSGEFIEANAEQLPFPDNYFDCVCSMGVLHHVPDTERAVAQIHRVLKPGGRLIVMFYHRDSVLYRFNFRLRSLFSGKPVGQLLNEYDGPGNPKGDVYSRDELARLLRAFTQLEMRVGHLQGYMLLPRIGRLVPDAWLRPLEGRWGFFLYAKARKLTGRA
jgi:ubiquinone/menaquinone biosynthesis C-methylase UbiE